MKLKIVCLSDTHNMTPRVPDGDMLIFAGDLTSRGRGDETQLMLSWLGQFPHPRKILVPGNHDFFFEKYPDHARQLCEEQGIDLLIDEGILAGGFHIWGSPWTPSFGGWAFGLDQIERQARWDRIPLDTEILITHCPPEEILDETHDRYHIGCPGLYNTLRFIRPDLHVFGHVHESQGVTRVPQLAPTIFVNASTYEPLGKSPIVVHL